MPRRELILIFAEGFAMGLLLGSIARVLASLLTTGGMP